MSTESTPRKPRLFVFASAGLFILLAIALLVLGLIGVTEWDVVADVLLITATLGTAIGTLGLAAYTFQLAQVTRESVAGAESQLYEVQRQGRALRDQVDATLQQTRESARLATSSASAAMSAERARVDAISPLVNLRVTLDNVLVTAGSETHSLDYQESWSLAELSGTIFVVSLKFSFRNVGTSPAQLSFGDTSTRLARVESDNVHLVVLEPGESYEDLFLQRFVGAEAIDGHLLTMPVTYNGLLHGEMFDHIQWNGWITPLKESGGVVTPHTGWIINASGATVIRSYPNLERPDEMRAVRARILNGGKDPD